MRPKTYFLDRAVAGFMLCGCSSSYSIDAALSDSQESVDARFVSDSQESVDATDASDSQESVDASEATDSQELVDANCHATCTYGGAFYYFTPCSPGPMYRCDGDCDPAVGCLP